VAAVLGSPGGSRIINYVARTLLALFAWNLAPGEALALPHVGSRNGPTELERGTAAEALKPALERLGHELAVQDMTSGLHLVLRRGGEWIGAADPRREGVARGE
jgi:gamma-glutamyltranspeptidase/glutathione hydrolase